MIRPSTITLVLMGGGLLLSGCDREDCRRARAEHRPDADQVCRNGSGGTHGGGGSYSRSGGSGTSTAAASTAGVSRGGFGSFASHFGFGG